MSYRPYSNTPVIKMEKNTPKKDELLRPPVKGAEEQPDEPEETPDRKQMVKSFAMELLKKDIPIAIAILVIIIGSLFAYTQNWPPMVVVESRSMMHGEDSDVGIIDTGDLVLVKKINSKSEITSYIEGKDKDYKTYGTHGDVIIYNKNGGGGTPVIHRAVVWIEFNDTTFIYNNITDRWRGGSYDIPELDAYGLTGQYPIPNYGHDKTNLMIDFKVIIDNFANFTTPSTGARNGLRTMPHSGFLTKGDSKDNIYCDQNSLTVDNGRNLVEPVKIKWIVGKAEGELPWFGLIKLWVGGEIDPDTNPAPSASVNGLVISLILIIAIPLSLDIILSHREKKKARKAEEEEAEAQEGKRSKRPKVKRIPKSQMDERSRPKSPYQSKGQPPPPGLKEPPEFLKGDNDIESPEDMPRNFRSKKLKGQ